MQIWRYTRTSFTPNRCLLLPWVGWRSSQSNSASHNSKNKQFGSLAFGPQIRVSNKTSTIRHTYLLHGKARHLSFVLSGVVSWRRWGGSPILTENIRSWDPVLFRYKIRYPRFSINQLLHYRNTGYICWNTAFAENYLERSKEFKIKCLFQLLMSWYLHHKIIWLILMAS